MSDRALPASRRIVIAGSGAAGLSLALALKTALGRSFEIVVADPALAKAPVHDARAYAIAAGGQAMLATLGVWDELAAASAPIHAMEITDSRTADAVRPIFLTFEGEVEPGRPFAHIVEQGPLSELLRQACEAAGVLFRSQGVARFDSSAGAMVEVAFSEGDTIRTALLVAADGARSRLREAAGIGWVAHDYRQSGIVATIGHERPHGGTAVEHFLPSGPFARLPLPDGGRLGHRSSIVWTEDREDAKALLSLDADDQLAEIERRFGLELGELALESPLAAPPLGFGIARAFVADRFALLGDAAHLIHPLAGQGLNLGLKDVAALAEAVVDAARLGLDIGGVDVLAGYERARRFDSLVTGLVMDGFNRLFSNDSMPLRLARDLGLGLVDRLPSLKGAFIRRASGTDGPRLLRGEAL